MTERPGRVYPGNVWIMPVVANDIVPVTEQVLSYESDGVLHLAASIGTVAEDGITYEMVIE